MDNVEICLLIAVILFGVAGAIRLSNKAYDSALIAFGFAVVVLSFIVSP